METSLDPKDFSIFVCDDEESIRNLLRTAISEWGFRVEVFPGAEETLEAIAAGRIPDVLLSDIRMQGMSGIDLAREVKHAFPGVEIVMMTAQGTLETAVQAMRTGVFDYLLKPFDDVDDVRKSLLHVCGRVHLRLQNERLVEQLRRQNEQTESLARMTCELAKTVDLSRVIQIGCEGLAAAFGSCPAAFFQYLPARRALVGSARIPRTLFGQGRPVIPVPADPASAVEALAEYIRGLDPGLVQAAPRRPVSGSPPKARRGAAPDWRFVEFMTRDTFRGVFILQVERWEEATQQVVRRHLDALSTAFENALSHARLLESSIKDELTGVFNLRHLRDRLDSEIRRAARLEHPVSIIFCDVDHFKMYNDAHGHQAGDEVLRLFAALMLKSFRVTDICTRYGGEEFCVVMPDTAFVYARAKADAFRAEVEKARFPREETQPLGRLTISIGVAEFPTHAVTVTDLLAAADLALYGAKKRGRNRVYPAVAPPGYSEPYKSRIIPTKRSIGVIPPAAPPAAPEGDPAHEAGKASPAKRSGAAS